MQCWCDISKCFSGDTLVRLYWCGDIMAHIPEKSHQCEFAPLTRRLETRELDDQRLDDMNDNSKTIKWTHQNRWTGRRLPNAIWMIFSVSESDSGTIHLPCLARLTLSQSWQTKEWSVTQTQLLFEHGTRIISARHCSRQRHGAFVCVRESVHA